MSEITTVYTCPMHRDIRQSQPGKCPKCGMALMPDSGRFLLLRHIASSPMHLVVMGAVVLGLVTALMMMLR